MSSKKCPNCGLYNLEYAIRCDCGYDFSSGHIEDSYLREKKPLGRNEQSKLGSVLNGVLGFVSGLILFLPSLWITYNLWDKFFFEILKNNYNTNTDDLLLIIFFYPAALVLSTILGIEGGRRGFRIKGKQWHAIVGSIIGGGIGGILTACLMTLVVVKGWVT